MMRKKLEKGCQKKLQKKFKKVCQKNATKYDKLKK